LSSCAYRPKEGTDKLMFRVPYFCRNIACQHMSYFKFIFTIDQEYMGNVVTRIGNNELHQGNKILIGTLQIVKFENLGLFIQADFCGDTIAATRRHHLTSVAIALER
jgi:hypothetical protein